MSIKLYNVGDIFVDEKSGKTLKAVERENHDCGDCIFSSSGSPTCWHIECAPKSGILLKFMSGYIPDSTPITKELLLANGFSNPFGDVMIFKSSESGFVIDVNEGFGCWLRYNGDNIGSKFTTIGELKAIAKALYKVELEFK